MEILITLLVIVCVICTVAALVGMAKAAYEMLMDREVILGITCMCIPVIIILSIVIAVIETWK